VPLARTPVLIAVRVQPRTLVLVLVRIL